jgi:hypothetical protein
MGTESLWTLRAKQSIVKCVLQVDSTWSELLILQDQDLTTREVFPDPEMARARAHALHERLIEKGWRDAS